MMRSIAIASIVVSTLSIQARTAAADEGTCSGFDTPGAYCFDVTTGSYNVSSNWVDKDGGHAVPTSSSAILIPAGREVSIVSTVAAKLANVEVDGDSRGKIIVKKDGVFKLGTPLTVSTLNGDLILNSAGGGTINPVLKLGGGHWIDTDGGGTIQSPDLDATITSDHTNAAQYRLTIGEGVTLTGRFLIMSQFTNDGTVNANAGGLIELASGSDPKGSGQWQVSASTAELKFGDDAITLSGTFTIEQGILRVNDDVTTAGFLYVRNAGRVIVAADKRFKAGL